MRDASSRYRVAWIDVVGFVVQAASASVEGTHARTLSIRTDKTNNGLADSADGTRLAVSNGETHNIAV